MEKFPAVNPFGIYQAPDAGIGIGKGVVAGERKGEMLVVFQGCETQCDIVRRHPVGKCKTQSYDIIRILCTGQFEGGGIAARVEA